MRPRTQPRDVQRGPETQEFIVIRGLDPKSVLRSFRRVQSAAAVDRPLVLAGSSERIETIRQALIAGGDARAVKVLTRPASRDLAGASVLVAVATDAPSADEEALLWQATRQRAGTVCVLVRASDPRPVANVLAENVIAIAPGDPMPLDRLFERIASEAGEAAYALAERLPRLRPAVSNEVVRRFSRRNGVLGVAIFVPGADFPALTLNEIRMVLRLAATHGQPITANRALELGAVVASGLALRSVARTALALLPGPAWFYKGGIAYSGTKAIGEAATSYFERGGFETLQGAVRRRS